MARTPEEGHTLECLSKTMIAVIENARDELIDAQQKQFAPITKASADFDFQIRMQANDPWHVAHEYLKDGTSECICPPYEYS